jgi:DNA-binding XRE family transcriptional regulator
MPEERAAPTTAPAPLTPQALRRWREQCGLTQRELGRRVGYSAAHVTMMERGRRAVSAPLAAYVQAHPAPRAAGLYALDRAGLERALNGWSSYVGFARWWGVAGGTVTRWRYGHAPLPPELRAWLRAGAPRHWDGCTNWHKHRGENGTTATDRL